MAGVFVAGIILWNKSKLSYEYRYFPSVDGNWGGISDAKKNIFNGMIGMLQRKVCRHKSYI